MNTELLVNVADLLRTPAARRRVERLVSVGVLGLADPRLDPAAEIAVDVMLDSLTDGITATGTISTPWHGECRRCLAPIAGTAVTEVNELFHTHPVDEDIWPVNLEQIDLDPIVREASLIDLPIAPLCRPDCRGLCATCGADRNETDCGHDDRPLDLRWGALEALRSQLEDPE